MAGCVVVVLGIAIAAAVQLLMAGGGAAAVAYNDTSFEEAWPVVKEEAVDKLIAYLDEVEELPRHKKCIPGDHYMRFYMYELSVAANLYYPDFLNPELDKMFDQYKTTIQDYISSKVLPSLRGKEKEIVLRELVRRWNHHKIMTIWLSGLFNFLSRLSISQSKLPSLVETSHLAFYNMVFGEIKDQVSDAIVTLIDREREGEAVDRALVAQVLDIFEQIGDVALRNYLQDIEDAIVGSSAKFYSIKALDWIATKSYNDYMLKVEECLEEEKNRVSGCLKLINKSRVLEVVKHELLDVHGRKLEEMKASS